MAGITMEVSHLEAVYVLEGLTEMGAMLDRHDALGVGGPPALAVGSVTKAAIRAVLAWVQDELALLVDSEVADVEPMELVRAMGADAEEVNELVSC